MRGSSSCLNGSVDRLEAFLAHRHLDDDVGRQLREVATFLQHAIDVFGHDLGADRARGDAADLDQHFVVALAARLGEQRRVGRHAVEHAPARRGADLIDLGGIQKDFHSGCSDHGFLAW
jgi:hypothetical protein